MPKIYDSARCHSCEMIFPIDDMLKDILGNHVCAACADPSRATGVKLGIVQVLETCARCGHEYDNHRGSGEGPEQATPCPKCSKKYCRYCGHAYPGETMIPIAGTPFVKCPHCNPGPTKNQNLLPRIA